MKKYLALVLSVLLLLSCCACAAKTASPRSLYAEAANLSPTDTVLTVNDEPITAAEYCYWLAYYCDNYDHTAQQYTTGKAVDWANDAGACALMLRYADSCVASMAYLRQLAAAHGVSLTEDDRKAIADSIASQLESVGGEEAFLAAQGMDSTLYAQMMESSYLNAGLLAAYSDPDDTLYPGEDVLLQYGIDNGYACADQIFFNTYLLPSDDADARAGKRAAAEEVYAQLMAEPDPAGAFAAYAESCGEDTGRAAYPNGYTYQAGEMGAEFEAAVATLDVDEISGIVESDLGYHIIIRRALRAEDLAEASYEDWIRRQTNENTVVTPARPREALDVPSFLSNLSRLRTP